MILPHAFLGFCLVAAISSAPQRKVDNGNFELIILHDNDMHARFEQTNAMSGTCSESDADNDRCFGGFARVANVVRTYRKKAEDGEIPSVLYLNAGDTYTGTPWFSLFREEITANFLKLLEPDAMSLGNHEFNEGSENLGKFLRLINFPVLAANLDLTNEPELQTEMLMNSKVFTIDGRQVGIIGYLTPETKQLTPRNRVEFLDEIITLNDEIPKLKAQGVNIIIALGHSGFEKDQQIAAECPDIDLVIGGHSHTFLYTGDVPDREVSEGDYPTIVTQPSGKKVPVVQAYAFTKYLGKIHLEFNDDGDLVEFDGSPIVLNSDIPREQDVLDLLEVYRPAILELQNEIVGVTKVLLDGSCRRNECNLGNFITDGMVDWRSLNYRLSDDWTDAPIAIIQAGGIRASISHESNNGNISMADAQTVLPWESKMEIIEITGETLISALEHSVHRYADNEWRGEFLQMSGMQVVFDMNQPSGQRVAEVKVLCAQCDVPELEPVDETKLYRIVTIDYLAEGGDGFDMFVGKTVVTSEDVDINVFADYLRKKSPVYPSVEWRIQMKPLLDPLEEVVGSTLVLLDSNCQQSECNLGNFITDAMVDWYALKYNDDSHWTDASIAMIQGSRIKASINSQTNGGIIKRSDAIKVFQPAFFNLNIVSLTGDEIVKMLERSVSNHTLADNVEFLQISGLQVIFDLSKPIGQRVTEVKALCAQCGVPELEPLKLNQEYKVIMQSILASGADGFGEIIGRKLLEDLEESDVNVFVEYLSKKSPVHPAVEWRITFHKQNDGTTMTPSNSSTTFGSSTTSVRTNPTAPSTTVEATTLGASNLQVSFALILLTALFSLLVKN